MEVKEYVEKLRETFKKVGDMSGENFDYVIISDDPDCDADYGIDYNGNLVINGLSTFLPVKELEHIRYRGTEDACSEQDCYVSFVFNNDITLYAYFYDLCPGQSFGLWYKGKSFSVGASSGIVTAINYGWNGNDDFVITKDGTLCGYLGQEKNIVVPDGVKRIAESAFENDYEIESIVLSDTVKAIEARAFLCTYKLKSIDLKNVEVIEDNAFRGSGLSNITLPVTLKELGKE
ncbi:MAG: leucine-rich repeat domain-containing protein, partial [Lachnospira sp.]|nr:leucine-rich repeat domain-containing protein [Lachnospira sp.]